MSQDVASPLADGRLRLTRLLGEGGVGRVYLAYDERLRLYRAVKILDQDRSANEAQRRRFETEAHIQARLRHPNVVQVFDIVEEGTQVYLVMEWVEGGSLWDRLRARGPLPPREVARAAEGILAALELAHSLDIVHRDIKPHNVLMSQPGDVPKLADFGVAHQEVGSPLQTRTGVVMGTWAFMAPEQRASSRRVDPRADLYSLGATMFTLLTDKLESSLFDHEPGAPPFDGIHPLLARIIWKATRYNRDERYQTATAMREDLAAAIPLLPEAPVSEATAPPHPPPPAARTIVPGGGDPHLPGGGRAQPTFVGDDSHGQGEDQRSAPAGSRHADPSRVAVARTGEDEPRKLALSFADEDEPVSAVSMQLDMDPSEPLPLSWTVNDEADEEPPPAPPRARPSGGRRPVSRRGVVAVAALAFAAALAWGVTRDGERGGGDLDLQAVDEPPHAARDAGVAQGGDNGEGLAPPDGPSASAPGEPSSAPLGSSDGEGLAPPDGPSASAPGEPSSAPPGSSDGEGLAPPDGPSASAPGEPSSAPPGSSDGGITGRPGEEPSVAEAGGGGEPSGGGAEPSGGESSGGGADPGPADAGDAVDPAQVRTIALVVARQNRGDVSRCHREAMETDPDVGGQVTLRWYVESGRVISREVVDDTTGNGAIADCLARASLGWSFPRDFSSRDVVHRFSLDPAATRREALAALFAGHGDGLAACRGSEAAGGSVEVRVDFGAGGPRVTVPSEPAGSELAECVAREVSSWEFPPYMQGTMVRELSL